MLGLFILLIVISLLVVILNSKSVYSKRFLTMKYRPVTYKSADIISNKMQLLIKSDEKHILNDIDNWKNSESAINDEKINNWIDQGIAFWSNPEGTRAMHIVERKKITENHKNLHILKPKIAADVYINYGTINDPIYVNADTTFSKDNLLNNNHKVYRNTSMLFQTEQVLHRADDIATRLKNEFEITSPEWERWTNKTTGYNASSLTQVFAEYFKKESIGDIGDHDVDYVPKPGYPGTLPPGIKFKDLYAFEDLPREVLHPWPAMQQIQFHVRWPPSHPMIPPPLLWIGLNDMYTENFTHTQLNLPDSEIVGGLLMEPKDAIRIAKYGKFGLSYVPEEQISHGGMIFDSACPIPNYNPDHGPTNPDPKNNLPEHMKSITERWLDPLFGLDIAPHKLLLESAELDDARNEEEERKKAFEKMLSTSQFNNFKNKSSTDGFKPLWLVAEEKEKEILEKEVDARVLEQSLALEKQLEDIYEQEITTDTTSSAIGDELSTMVDDVSIENDIDDTNTLEDKSNLFKDVVYYDINANLNTVSIQEKLATEYLNDEMIKRNKFRNEILNAQKLINVAKGNARGKRAIIKYTVEVMNDLCDEIVEEEKNVILNAKKNGRRGKSRRKGDGSSNDDDSLIAYNEVSSLGLGSGDSIGGFDSDSGGGGDY